MLQGMDLKRHLKDTYGVAEDDFERLMEEFRAFFGSTLEEFVRSRHLQLQKQGKRNPEIYRQIIEEASETRFAEKDLSERRVRRLIYG
jgi:hypothetical protein